MPASLFTLLQGRNRRLELDEEMKGVVMCFALQPTRREGRLAVSTLLSYFSGQDVKDAVGFSVGDGRAMEQSQRSGLGSTIYLSYLFIFLSFHKRQYSKY